MVLQKMIIELSSEKLLSKVFYVLFFISFFTFLPSLLLATSGSANSNAITAVICNIVVSLTGSIGQGISTVAIIFVCIGMFLGKMHWGLAMSITVGIGGLFGAPNVVEWVSGTTLTECAQSDVTGGGETNNQNA